MVVRVDISEFVFCIAICPLRSPERRRLVADFKRQISGCERLKTDIADVDIAVAVCKDVDLQRIVFGQENISGKRMIAPVCSEIRIFASEIFLRSQGGVDLHHDSGRRIVVKRNSVISFFERHFFLKRTPRALFCIQLNGSVLLNGDVGTSVLVRILRQKVFREERQSECGGERESQKIFHVCFPCFKL